MISTRGIVGDAGGPQAINRTIVNEVFHLHTGTASTIAVAVSAGDTSITLVDATGFVIGNAIQINNGNIETTFPVITALPGGNVLTLDRPLDYDYLIGDDVEVVHTDLKTTAGSLASPVIHKLQPEAGVVWHIERLIFSMTHATAATDDKFGDLAALANGVIIRTFINGQFISFTNWKDNAGIRLDMFDVFYSDKAGPTLFGTSGRLTFARLGAVVELNGNNGDYMDVLIQDNLTGLSSFFLNGQGHVAN